MGWLKNVTKITKWGLTTKNFFVGMYEEITEHYSNFTENARMSIERLENIESLKDIDSVEVSRKALVVGSALISSQSFRDKAFKIIAGASTNMWF